MLAITTDLSAAYLSPPTPVELVVLGLSSLSAPPRVLDLTPARTPRWYAGLRVLKFEVSSPLQKEKWTLQIRPKERALVALSASDVCPAAKDGSVQDGLILPVYVDLPAWDGNMQAGMNQATHVCFRSLRLVGNVVLAPSPHEAALSLPPQAGYNPLQIEEELGESMARHIWDAGLITACLAAQLRLGSGSEKDMTSLSASTFRTAMPKLARLLASGAELAGSLNMIELGCGVGIAGIGIAQMLRNSDGMGPSAPAWAGDVAAAPYVLLTDLPHAEECARQNMARCTGTHLRGRSDRSTEQLARLDYENLDWEEGQDGRFGPLVRARAWDLVLITDCTYNDSMPSLVRTASALHAHSADRILGEKGEREGGGATKVLLATKRRHEAEERLFELMEAERWAIEEETVVPLPVLGGRVEAIEAYLFSRRQ